MKFEKITNVRLPFDMRAEDPKKNYGIHGLDVWFILKGEKGAVQFACNFSVYLPHVTRELWSKPDSYMREKIMSGPIMGFDVGYHAHEPQYEDQKPMECQLFPEKKQCYYDGSTLRADEWAKEIFSTIGRHPEEVIWEKLEDEYKRRFGERNG